MVLERLQETLAAIQAERRDLEAAETEIKSMIARFSGGASSMQFSASRPASTPVRTTSRVIAGRDRDKLDDIADILRAEGNPLHITVIAERLSAKYGKTVDRTTIEPGINRHIQKVKARRIEKFAPSTFGLPEWKSQQPLLAHTA